MEVSQRVGNGFRLKPCESGEGFLCGMEETMSGE